VPVRMLCSRVGDPTDGDANSLGDVHPLLLDAARITVCRAVAGEHRDVPPCPGIAEQRRETADALGVAHAHQPAGVADGPMLPLATEDAHARRT
jgi:hypothetical protein